MHLYFIRHGESESNYGELITGRQDVVLTDKGREQARQAGQDIIAKGIKIDHIISSPLVRAQETAKLIAQEVGYPEGAIKVNDLVIERSFGSLEGQPKNLTLTSDDEYVTGCGGESQEAILARAQEFVDSLKGIEGTVLVVSHTGFGRRLRAVVKNITVQHSKNFKNAQLTDLGEL